MSGGKYAMVGGKLVPINKQARWESGNKPIVAPTAVATALGNTVQESSRLAEYPTRGATGASVKPNQYKL